MPPHMGHFRDSSTTSLPTSEPCRSRWPCSRSCSSILRRSRGDSPSLNALGDAPQRQGRVSPSVDAASDVVASQSEPGRSRISSRRGRGERRRT